MPLKTENIVKTLKRGVGLSDSWYSLIPKAEYAVLPNILGTVLLMVKNVVREEVEKAVRKETKSLTDKIDYFQKSVEYYSRKLDEFTTLMEDIKSKSARIEKEHKNLQDKYDLLQRKLEEQTIATEEANQYGRNKNLQIDGIPEGAGEDLASIIEAIGSNIGTAVKKTDIEAIHRVSRHNGNMQKRPIILQFARRSLRDEFLQKSKSKRPSTVCIFKESPAQPIYVNEHMTPYFSSLFHGARTKKDANDARFFKYVWFKNGKLFVRKSETAQVRRVVCVSDLQ